MELRIKIDETVIFVPFKKLAEDEPELIYFLQFNRFDFGNFLQILQK